MSLLLGFGVLFVIPFMFALAFWGGPVRWLCRQWDARDVMGRFRPNRRRVGAIDRRVKNLHIDLHWEDVPPPACGCRHPKADHRWLFRGLFTECLSCECQKYQPTEQGVPT